MNRFHLPLRGKYSLFVLLSFILSASNCNESYKEQVRDCIVDYGAAYEDCNFDPTCQDSAFMDYQSCAGTAFKFPIHFVIMTPNLILSESEIEQLMVDQIDTLNRLFSAEDSRFPPENRRRLVTFEFKSITHYARVQSIGGQWVDSMIPDYDFEQRLSLSDSLAAMGNAEIWDENAINFFVVDARGHSNSHGNVNQNKPYLFIDYQRINGDRNRVGVQEHEMGHCFALAHLCEANTNGSSPTNIMATGGSWPVNDTCAIPSGSSSMNCDSARSGSSGLRNIGFNDCQVNTILTRAEILQNSLGLP